MRLEYQQSNIVFSAFSETREIRAFSAFSETIRPERPPVAE
ncbi:hypothetical protein [Brevibacterium sp. RIT 803]|nr:hypothetical protein [Brevibacterium sp. RIT 803]